MEKKGFTLVELAIVLMIIGLLIGGILVAQSMTSTAKIQRLIRDLSQYEISVNNFKQNYKYYPGDDGYFNPPGNQDNQLSAGFGGTSCSGVYDNYEYYQIWAHLYQAGMISTLYIPYSSPACGGSMTSLVPNSSPFTFVDEHGHQGYVDLSGNQPIRPNLWTGGNFYFTIVVSPSWVLPLESKIGTTSDNSPGIYNSLGSGNCKSFLPWYPPGSTVTCTNNTANIGMLIYYINQI